MGSLNHTPFERKFELHNVKYELVEEVLLDSITKRESVQVRRHSMLAPPVQVQRYAMAMQAGQEFPPIVLWGDVILDGNTRVAAARQMGRTSIPAYRVQCRNERQAIILGAALNQLNGRSLTEEEAREAAEEMLDDGMTDQYIAREVQVSAAKVRRWRLERSVMDRAATFGVAAEVDSLSKSRRQQLVPVTHERPFKELVGALVDHNPSNAQLKHVLAEIESAPSDDAAVQTIRDAVDGWEPVGKYRDGQAAASTARKANAPIGALLKHDAAFYVDATLADDQLPKWESLAALAASVVEEYRRVREIAA